MILSVHSKLTEGGDITTMSPTSTIPAGTAIARLMAQMGAAQLFMTRATMTHPTSTTCIVSSLSLSVNRALIMQSEPQDTDSDGDVYQRFHVPSSEDLGQGMRTPFPEAPTPTYLEPTMPHGSRDAYPAWTPENNSPLSKEEIEDIFLDLTQKFGFQRDSMRNMASLFIHPGATPVATAAGDFILCRSSFGVLGIFGDHVLTTLPAVRLSHATA